MLIAIAVAVGVLIGAVGVGGILLIPAIDLLTPLSIQQSMATALCTFIATGVVGTVLFQRRGSIDWAVTAPLCVGAAVFGFLGGWANARLTAGALSLILSGLIIVAGLYTLSTGAAARTAAFEDRPALQRALLLATGAFAGFGSGLTGVGGPALSVPVMVLFGFSPLVAIGASQVIQVLAALSGSAANLIEGTIDFRLASLLIAFEVVGVWIGTRIAHSVDARLLRRAVGVLCVVVGASLLARALA